MVKYLVRMRCYFLALILVSLNAVSGQVAMRDSFETKYKPGITFGSSLVIPSVFEGEGIQVIAANLGYNFILFSNKSSNLSIEPNLTVGFAKDHFLEPNRPRNESKLSISNDLSVIFRKRLGRLQIGFGTISGYTWVRNDYFYTAYLGPTFRLGYILNKNLAIECGLNVQYGDYFMEGKVALTANLIKLRF